MLEKNSNFHPFKPRAFILRAWSRWLSMRLNWPQNLPGSLLSVSQSDIPISEAETKESDSNHIQDFTKNIKAMDKNDKIEIIKNIWSIILSDGTSDMYEENLMRRLAGLLYVDAKTMGDIKLDILTKIK